jgi:hypothetical protein
MQDLSRLMRWLDGTPAFNHVAVALRGNITKFASKVPPEFKERGQDGTLDILLTQVCSASDPWFHQLLGAVEESLAILSLPEEIDRKRVQNVIHPVSLLCRVPPSVDEGAMRLYRMLMQDSFAEWAAPLIESCLWESHSVPVLRQMIRSLPNPNGMFALFLTLSFLQSDLSPALSRVLLATQSPYIAKAVLEEFPEKDAEKYQALISLATAVLEANPSIARVRADFANFQVSVYVYHSLVA